MFAVLFQRVVATCAVYIFNTLFHSSFLLSSFLSVPNFSGSFVMWGKDAYGKSAGPDRSSPPSQRAGLRGHLQAGRCSFSVLFTFPFRFELDFIYFS